ncbi:MAG TPA: helix-turn-helix domain-containing protein [Ktedonobacterales bacterium]|nr:helix-turn-helix domain-containing protein [Ktedonobacterales bacterium]
MGTRTYHQRQRAQSAEATRQRIVDAARACLIETPLLAVGMERIAEAAGVARRTIYQIFGSRVGLFAALEQDLFLRGRFVEIQDAFNKNADARQILEETLPASVRLMQREEAILRALFLQSLIDPEAATLTKRIEEGRIGGMRYLARLLVEQGYARPDLTQAEVGDILALLTDFATYDQLKTRMGLSPEDILRRLHILAARLLR